MANPSSLPKSTFRWKASMDNEGLNLNDRIHDFENAKSASNIDFPQYLLLRVLYQEPKPASTLPEPDNQDYWFGKDNVDKASGVLKSLSSWIEYVKYSKSAWSSNQQPICPIPESIGTFSLVYYYQQLVHRDIDAETRYSAPKLDFTPIAKRTRLATTAAASRVVLPATPTPSSRNAQSTWPGAAEDYDSIIDGLEQLDSGFSDTPQSSLQAISPMSSAPEDQATYNRAVEDEQIVNTCLLLFLHAISVHVQVQGLGSKWTLHRRSFRVQSGPEKVFEARVDGYLLMSDGTAGAVIEVKPFLRTRQGDAIRMQEAAQLAAWICDQPPREKLATGRKYTRLLISQDRHEVYLSFAEFDSDYVDYICKANTEKLSFLNVQEFGPFRVNNGRHMDPLSRLVPAYMMKVST